MASFCNRRKFKILCNSQLKQEHDTIQTNDKTKEQEFILGPLLINFLNLDGHLNKNSSTILIIFINRVRKRLKIRFILPSCEQTTLCVYVIFNKLREQGEFFMTTINLCALLLSC